MLPTFKTVLARSYVLLFFSTLWVCRKRLQDRHKVSKPRRYGFGDPLILQRRTPRRCCRGYINRNGPQSSAYHSNVTLRQPTLKPLSVLLLSILIIIIIVVKVVVIVIVVILDLFPELL